MENESNVFSILAIDVLVDTQFQPFILEFNGSWYPMIKNTVKEDVLCKNVMPAFISLVRQSNNTSSPAFADENCILCYAS